MSFGSTPAFWYAARRTAERSSSGRVSLKPPFFACCHRVRHHTYPRGGARTFVIAVRTAAHTTTSSSFFTKSLPLPTPVIWEILFEMAAMVVVVGEEQER
jgi:hypothetical protein